MHTQMYVLYYIICVYVHIVYAFEISSHVKLFVSVWGQLYNVNYDTFDVVKMCVYSYDI